MISIDVVIFEFQYLRMYNTLVVLIIGLVLAIICFNVFFRVRVMKYYKKLVKARVEFDLNHIINKDKLEKEIIPKYPDSESDIRAFIHQLKISARIGMILFVLISFFGWVLMHYR